jgi:regulator of protease activity HflC (stomatin/prohibitin superfamily)
MKTFLPGLIGILLSLVLLMLLVGVAARGLMRYRVTISEWQRGLLYVNGGFRTELGPGRYWTGILGRQIYPVITARLLALVPAQEVLTADGFPVKLGAVADYRVTSPRLTHESTAGQWMESVRIAIQLALRAVAQSRGLEALLAARDELEAELLPAVQKATAPIGITIDRVALRDLILPAETRRLVTEIERARREAQAALERARGEHAALRSLANAARMLRNNPELQTLRVLQSLNPTQGRPAPTLVLGGGAVMPLRPAGDISQAPASEEEGPPPG